MESKFHSVVVHQLNIKRVVALIVRSGVFYLANESCIFKHDGKQVLAKQDGVDSTVYLYLNNTELLAQTKNGEILVLSLELEMKGRFWLSIFPFCKISIEAERIFYYQSTPEDTGIVELAYLTSQKQTHETPIKQELQASVFAKSGDTYLVGLDGGHVYVLQGTNKMKRHYQVGCFIFDCSVNAQDEKFVAYLVSEKKQIHILWDYETKIIDLQEQYTKITLYQDKILLMNKMELQVIGECRFVFFDLRSYFLDKEAGQLYLADIEVAHINLEMLLSKEEK